MKTITNLCNLTTACVMVLALSSSSVYAADTYLDVDTDAEATIGGEGITVSSSVDADIQLEPGSNFSLSYEDVGATAPRDERPAEEPPVSSAWVESEKDLRAYVGVVIRTQPQIQELAVSSNKVSLQMRDEALLFGLIAVALPVTIETDVTGEVVVRYPWYSFATTDRNNTDEVNIKNYVEPLFEHEAVLTSKGSFTAYGQALVVDEVLEAYAKSEVVDSERAPSADTSTGLLHDAQ